MTNKKTIKKSYVKERKSPLLEFVQANPDMKVNQRAIAKINTLLYNKEFKKDVSKIRNIVNITEDILEKEVYSLIKKWGFSRDWYNTFNSIVWSNTFVGIIEGETIHIKDTNMMTETEIEDYKAVSPIAIFIKPDTTISELKEYASKNWVKIHKIQNKYVSSLKKVNPKSAKDLDIEAIIIKNQDKTSEEIAEIISKKYSSNKGKSTAEIKYGVNYIDKAKSKLRKNMLNS